MLIHVLAFAVSMFCVVLAFAPYFALFWKVVVDF